MRQSMNRRIGKISQVVNDLSGRDLLLCACLVEMVVLHMSRVLDRQSSMISCTLLKQISGHFQVIRYLPLVRDSRQSLHTLNEV